MGQFSSFDELPLIVHDGILCSLASPQDVANTIRASPGSLQAFVTGRRNVVLLAALQNYLSLENQHLMNLVMAAPYYYKHGETGNESTVSTCVEFDGVTRDDFDRAFRYLLHNIHRPGYLQEINTRPLTMNTLHCSIKMYTIMDKEVRYYGLFTLARSQHRIHKLSNPRTFLSHHQSPDCAAPDDREIQKIWRGFLIHELCCIVFGIPEVSAAASNETHYNTREWRGISRFISKIPPPVCEELICVQQYVRDQYDLAFNGVVDSFELAVNKMGRRTSGSSMSPERSITEAIELTRDGSPKPVRYLFELGNSHNTSWTHHMAMLGVSFLHEFFSWDSTTRIGFIRTTYPFLCRHHMFIFNDLFMHRYHVRDVAGIHAPLLRSGSHDLAARRLRAVGWIFWESPNRLASMNLVQGSVDATYWSLDGILTPLSHRPRSVFLNRSLEPQDWEYIIREFGTPYNDVQPTSARSLFNSTGSLNRTKVAEIASVSLQQVVDNAAAEARNEWK